MINNKIKECFNDFFQPNKGVKDFKISMRKKNELVYHFYLDNYNENTIPVIEFKNIYKFNICLQHIKATVVYLFAFINNKWQASVQISPQNKNIKNDILDFLIMKEIKKEKRIVNISNVEKFIIKQGNTSFSILFEFDCFNFDIDINLETNLNSEAFNKYVKERVFDCFNIKIRNSEIQKIETIFLPLLLRGDFHLIDDEIKKFKIKKSNVINFSKEELEYFELLYAS